MFEIKWQCLSTSGCKQLNYSFEKTTFNFMEKFPAYWHKRLLRCKRIHLFCGQKGTQCENIQQEVNISALYYPPPSGHCCESDQPVYFSGISLQVVLYKLSFDRNNHFFVTFVHMHFLLNGTVDFGRATHRGEKRGTLSVTHLLGWCHGGHQWSF